MPTFPPDPPDTTVLDPSDVIQPGDLYAMDGYKSFVPAKASIGKKAKVLMRSRVVRPKLAAHTAKGPIVQGPVNPVAPVAPYQGLSAVLIKTMPYNTLPLRMTDAVQAGDWWAYLSGTGWSEIPTSSQYLGTSWGSYLGGHNRGVARRPFRNIKSVNNATITTPIPVPVKPDPYVAHRAKLAKAGIDVDQVLGKVNTQKDERFWIDIQHEDWV